MTAAHQNAPGDVTSLVSKWMSVAHGLRALGDDKAAEATDECAAELAAALNARTQPAQVGGLLPCPGCGGNRTRVIGGPGTKGGPKHWAGCDICRWRTWGDTEADAIAAWNTRFQPDDATGVLVCARHGINFVPGCEACSRDIDELADTPPPTSASPQVGDELLDRIGELLRTQDNRVTSHPIFVVEQVATVYGVEPEFDGVLAWIDGDGEVDPETAAQLEHDYQNGEPTPKGFRRSGYVERWEFVTACFTEQGCKDYLQANGHNLRRPRIYVRSGWRNAEWIALRERLSAQPPAVSAEWVVDDAMVERAVKAYMDHEDMNLTRDVIQAMLTAALRIEAAPKVAK